MRGTLNRACTLVSRVSGRVKKVILRDVHMRDRVKCTFCRELRDVELRYTEQVFSEKDACSAGDLIFYIMPRFTC